MGHEKDQPTEEKTTKGIHVGETKLVIGSQIANGGQAGGHVQGSQRWGPEPPGMHSEFSTFSSAAYNMPPPLPYHPPAYPYGGGYPPQYHNTLGVDPKSPEVLAAVQALVEAEMGHKPLPKTEGESTKPVALKDAAAADPAPRPAAAAATCQQPPRNEPPPPPPAAAHGYSGWDVAAGGGYPPPQYGYPPRHGGGYYDGGGYPVQGYPTHHGYGHGHGHGHGGGGYGYYGYGTPPQQQHMGMGRIAAGAAAFHEAYHRYRQHGRQGADYGHYQGGHGGYGPYGHHQGGYGHHGKFQQGHYGKYSHYYGPHPGRGGKFGVN